MGRSSRREVVDILNAAEQRDVADVAVHSERARADADDARVAAGVTVSSRPIMSVTVISEGASDRGGALLRFGRLGVSCAGADWLPQAQSENIMASASSSAAKFLIFILFSSEYYFLPIVFDDL